MPPSKCPIAAVLYSVYNKVFSFTKVKLMTKDINIVLVDEFEGAHVPLLSVTSVVNAKAADWSSQVNLSERKIFIL